MFDEIDVAGLSLKYLNFPKPIQEFLVHHCASNYLYVRYLIDECANILHYENHGDKHLHRKTLFSLLYFQYSL